MGFECDPDLCKKCFYNTPSGNEPKNLCRNQALTLRRHRRTIVGISQLCEGLGLFSAEFIPKEEFIIEYLGEIIESDEAEKREKFDKFDNELYLFNLTDNLVLDSKYKGNKARFINHSKNPNCFPRPIFFNGEYHIGLFAKRDIQIGEELTFNYDGSNGLKDHFKWINQKERRIAKANNPQEEQNQSLKKRHHSEQSPSDECNEPEMNKRTLKEVFYMAKPITTNTKKKKTIVKTGLIGMEQLTKESQMELMRRK